MSPGIRNTPARQRAQAPVFAALGDETRLSLIAKLSGAEPCSIAQLTDGTDLTRQAVTKHLRVLEDAGVVRSVRSGRENLFALDGKPLGEAKDYLDTITQQWAGALSRLKEFVER